MKNIALITDGWKRYVTYGWVCGIRDRAKELGIDICLYTFNTNGNLSHDEKFNEGEYSLYELVDYSCFDGFIFDCTNTNDPLVIESVVNKLKQVSVPVVSISFYVEGFYYVGNDNKNLIREMVDHMFNVHGCRKMVYAGGPKNNYENKQRFEGFCEALSDHGLALEEGSFMFGDYDFDTGVRYLTEWLDAGKEFPDAFICANDNIAAGICCEAEKRGYKIPDDFRVTGFDNLDKAAYYKPQIATVNHNRGKLSGVAFDILLARMNGEDVPVKTYMHSDILPSESCGCKNTGTVDYRDYAKWQIDWSVARDRYDENTLELEKRFADCRNMQGLFDSFTDYMSNLDCAGIIFCVDEALLKASPDEKLSDKHFDFKKLKIVSGIDHGKKLYSLRTMLDLMHYLVDTDVPRDYIALPIHFRNLRVGVTFLLEPDFLYDFPFFYDAHHAFIDRLENLYIQTQLSNSADRMKALYNRDVLTGLYNRISYNEVLVPKFDIYQQKDIDCAICFFDVDHFKEINDTFGHDFGDKVLVTIAKTLKSFKPKDSFAYRFGGDEFVVFIPYATPEKVERFSSRVVSELEGRNIDISTGVIFTEKGVHRTSDEYLVTADEHMYRTKRERHIREAEEKGPMKKPDVETALPIISFYKGMDISSLPEKEEKGFRFRDTDGSDIDPLDLLIKNNVNSVRLRIWNDPKQFPESGGYCDLEHTLKLARRIKDKGLQFMLDFHYSDYWADPGQQRKPAEWADYDLERLSCAVYLYTHDVLIELSKIDALPDMVQIGNEIRSGMLFPEGAVPDYNSLALLVNSGIRAVRDISEDIEIMIHLDQGGRFYMLREWFDAMFAAGMEKIDSIGISYYSFWHGTFKDLKDSITQLTDRYDLPVFVVETAHPWRHCEHEHVSKEMMTMAGFPAGVEEQKKSLLLTMQVTAQAAMPKKTGVFYWEPLCIPDNGFGTWDENMGMLDTTGKALASFEAFRDFDPAKPPIEDVDSYIDSLYRIENVKLPEGTDILSVGGSFAGYDDWWIGSSPEDGCYKVTDDEVFVESKSNFKFWLARDIMITTPGKYSFLIDYRGSNTTGVNVKMFIKSIKCSGEEYLEKPIYPSDVDFVTHSIDGVHLDIGSAQIGIEIEAPPINARIRNPKLILVSDKETE